MIKKLTFILCFFLSLSLLGQEKSLNLLTGKELTSSVRLQYYSVDMPLDKVTSNIDEKMGLMSAHYTLPVNEWLYVGTGMYAALFGDQGGLFTLGVDIGINTPIAKNLFLDSRIHIGGGGGYRYLVNGGMIFNPNIGLKYKLKGYSLGVNYSYINFTDGLIKDDGISFSLEIPSTFRYSSYENSLQEFYNSNLETNSVWNKPITKNVQQLRFDTFFPFGNSKKDNGSDLNNTLYVVGFEYQQYLLEKTFFFAHLDAIYKGLTAGFMDFFIGGGYNLVQTNGFNLFGKMAVGAAGGRIFPEGGITLYPSAGLDIKITPKLGISAHGGYYRALDGDFEAYTLGFGVKYFNLSGGTKDYGKTEYKYFKTQGIRVGVENQYYHDMARYGNDVNNENVSSLAIKFMYDLNPYFYLIGEGSFAYKGKSGGYAHGVFGLGYQTPKILNNHLSFYLEATGGAAGGGRIDTGEGLVIRPIAGLQFHASKDVSLSLSGGILKSFGGNVNSTNINLGVSYGFSSLMVKNKKN